MAKTMKKLVSFVLAFAMVLAFVPAGLIGAQAEDVVWAGKANSVYYTMPAVRDGQQLPINAIVDYSSTTSLSYGKYEVGDTYPTGIIADDGAPTGKGLWKFGGEYAAYQNKVDYLRIDKGNRRLTVLEGRNQDAYFTMDLKLPEVVGSYALTAELFKTVASAADAYDIYLIPEGESAAESIANDENLLSTVYMSEANTTTAIHRDSCSYTVGKFDVTKENAGDEITLAIVTSKHAEVTEPEEGKSYWTSMYFYGYGLNGNPTNAITEAYFDNDETVIGTGETLALALAATMLDGSAADLSNATITYATSDEAIATVDANGVVTQVGNGEVTISATIVDGATIEKAYIDLTCIDWAGEENVVTYNFTGVSGDIGTITDYGKANANWYEIAGNNLNAGPSADNKFNRYANGRVQFAANDANNLYAPVIKLPEVAGKYVLSMRYLNSTYGGNDLTLYFCEKNATTAGNPAAIMADANILAQTKRTADDATVVSKLAVITVTPDMAGKEYILGLNLASSVNSSGWVGTYGLMIYNYTLTGVGEEVLSKVALTADKAKLDKNVPTQLALSAKMSDGSDAEGYTVTYASNNADFVVDANGVVTANADGKAVITATVTLGDIIATAEVELTCGVIWAGKANSVYYTMPAVRDSQQLPISAIVDYSSTTSLSYGKYEVGDTYPTGIIADNGAPTGKGLWKFGGEYAAYQNNVDYLRIDKGNRRLTVLESRNQDAYFTLDLKLPEVVGSYALTAEMSISANAAADAYDIYMIPEGATAAESIANGENLVSTIYMSEANKVTAIHRDSATYTVGKFDVTEENAGEEITLAIVTSKKAEVTEPAEGSNYWTSMYFYGYGLKGNPENVITEAYFANKETAVKEGETLKLNLKGTMLDGSNADLTAATVTYTSSDDTIATVDANGVVTQVGSGYATITATIVDGATIEKAHIDLTCGVIWAGAANTANYYLPNLSGNVDFTKVTKDYDFGNIFENTVANAGSVYYGGASDASSLTLDANYRVRVTEARGTNAWFAVTVDLPNATGRYALKLNTAPSAGTDAVDIYSVPAGANAADSMTDANLIGTRFFNWDANSYEKGQKLAGIQTIYTTVGYFDVTEENKGTAQTFVIKTSDKATITESYKEDGTANSTYSALYFYGFKFDGAEQNALASIALSADKTRLMDNETATLTLTGKMLNGADADLSAATVAYTSSDETVATVENGVVVAKSEGTATITATALLGSAYALASIDVKCGSWAGAKYVEVYDFTKSSGNDIGSLTAYNVAGNTNWYEIADNHINAGLSEDGKFNRYAHNRAQFAATTADNLFAPVIKLPNASGKYVLSMSYLNANYGGNDFTFYLCENNENNAGNPGNIMDKANVIAQTKHVPGESAVETVANVAVINVTPDMAGKEYILGINAATSLGNSSWVGTHGIMIYNFTLTGTGSEVLSSANLVAKNSKLTIGVPEQLFVNAFLSDGSVAEGYTVAYESNHADFAVDANGVVTAIGVGEATITAIVSLGDVVKAATTKVYVEASEDVFPGAGSTIYYDFAKTPFGGASVADLEGEKSYYYYPEDMPEENYTDGNGPEGSTADKMFKFHSMNDGSIRRMKTKEGKPTTNWYSYNEGDWLAVTVTLPTVPGLYTAQVNTYAWSRGAEELAMYIIDANTINVEEALKTATPVGTANLVHILENYVYLNTPYAFNCGTYQVTAENAGTEKIIVLKTVKAGNAEYGANIGGVDGLSGVTLAGIQRATLESVAISAAPAKTTLAVGETAQFGTLSGTMSDGSVAVFDIVSYESTNPKAFPIDQNGVLTCDAGGKTTVIVSGLANGVKKSLTFDITCDAPTFASVNVTVDKANLAEGETANVSIADVTLTDGSVVDLDAAIAAKKASVSFDFDDEIVDVSSSERTITYVADGTTTVTVAINYYGVIITKELEITCGVVEPEVPTEPEPVLMLGRTGANLSLDNEIFVNIKFMFDASTIPAGKTLADYIDRVGVLVFNDGNISEEDATFENSNQVLSGESVKVDGTMFSAVTDGIPAKNMGDAKAYRPYFKKADGTYNYGSIKAPYSPAIYCYNMLDPKKDQTKAGLYIAILNYGTAAQKYFSYNTGNLMNKDLTAEQQAKVTWSDSLVRRDEFWVEATAAKAKAFTTSSFIPKAGTSLALEGAIINKYSYQVTDASKVAEAKILFWTEEAFNKATELTADNASSVAELTYTGKNNIYQAEYEGLPAKKMFQPIYACAMITDVDGNVHYSEVKPNCPEKYTSDQLKKTTERDIVLGKALAMYGDQARKWLN